MELIPITLRLANQYVSEKYRHHKPSRGHKFSVGLLVEGTLVGVAICGRPVSRGSDNGFTLEVSRLCTDGTTNACSKLYGACARIAKEMGYKKIQTYVLQDESGTTLKASGWILEAITAGGQWKYKGGKSRRTDQPTEPKQRWVRYL